jgi:hypothetical protein
LSSNSSAANVAHAQSGDDPRTVEIQADVQKLCPPYVIVSNNPDRADYILVFRREGGKRTTAFAFGGLAGLAIAAGAKVDGSSLFLLNGDMVFATKENTVQKAIKYTCEHIPPPVAAPAVTPTPWQLHNHLIERPTSRTDEKFSVNSRYGKVEAVRASLAGRVVLVLGWRSSAGRAPDL